tara:strand:- start:1397 stop:2656 length:1260 start_codon:yes stop_codon:yes gene_type:complete
MSVVINGSRTKENIANTDILIIGGGMVGLSLAFQIKKKYPDLSIKILDKEKGLGFHNSGRNSGVLHAGIYYEPGSLKAKVCIEGSKRLREWCLSEGIKVLACGKIIVTQRENQDKQLNLLYERGIKNGANVELIDQKDLKNFSPYVYNATQKLIWSPNTCVVDPKSVVQKLAEKLIEMGVEIIYGANIFKINSYENTINYSINLFTKSCSYGHLFNCCGVNTDSIAKKFGIAKEYKILPFKGIYWKLKDSSSLSFNTNIYPVPDLNLPFLGVHITPNLNGEVFFGPTAFPAFGKENYNGFNGFEPLLTSQFISTLTLQWLKNRNGFRKYAYEQGLHGFKPFFLKAVQAIVPILKNEDLIKSSKVGIRAQLFDKNKKELVQDFKLINGENSTHVLNAISPAFTASFALADLIIEKSKFFD